MFPLAGKDFPESRQQLADAIRRALAEILSLPKNNQVVTIEGGKFPAIDRVKVDLSNASVSSDLPPPPPKPAGKREPGPVVSDVQVVARPLRYQDGKAEFQLDASDVRFDFARDAQGNAMLVLRDARSGHVEVMIGQDDLQSLLKAAAGMAARQQGVTIQDLQVKLSSQGPRAIDAEARVKARKMVMSGTLTLRARVEIDDELVATLSNLSASGEGMIGSMAAGLIQGKLKQLQGERIPLTAFSLGDIRLHHLSVSTEQGLQITAQFGGV